MKHYYLFLLVFIQSFVSAQEIQRAPLKGKVTSDTSDLIGIYIINTNTEEASETENGGYFSVLAKPGDTLMFTSTRFKARKIVAGAQDFNGGLLFVALESMIQLDEVVVQRYKNINAASLGIIPAGQKKYTLAERRLKTAGDLKPTDFIGILGGSMPTDPIINAISGRTAMLKKEVAFERKEMSLSRLADMYEDKYFTDYLKIPAIYVGGFKYFIVENDRFTAALDSKNKTMLAFMMAELAVKYKDTIACDQE